MRFVPGIFIVAGLMAAPAAAQTPRAAAAETAQKRTMARRATDAPVIDGVLDERAWQDAVPVSDFVQAEPAEGQPATEKTEVRLLYDDKMIYVGVVCYDEDPSKIVTTDSRRDSGLDAMDSFRMIFDTYHDRQNGFIFGTNVTGIEYDAQVRNEGETIRSGPPSGLGGGNAGGSGAGVNVNWDASWEVKTRVTQIGWTAEFAIPLRTLRYGPPPQVWGVNFSRNIQRKREQVYWSPISRIYTLTRLSSAGELRDLNVPAPRDLKLMPYTIGSANRNFTAGADTDLDGDWGIDAKVGVTSSTTLDLTYNTDFAQVEVDEQQINLTRFNLLFPEKRPFFLENRGLFAVGRNGEVDLFFSRRIGITDAGVRVPIQGGARLTGKVAGVNVGLLNMQTERVGGTAANNFSAVRASKDLRNRSSVGAIFVNRTATGDSAGDANWNRTWGLDSKWGVGEAITFNGFAARTETPGLGTTLGRQHAVGSGAEYRNRSITLSTTYTQVGEDFNPEVGFLERTDGYRQTTVAYRQNVRSGRLAGIGVREVQPHATYESYWGFDGFQETATLHLDNLWDFEKGHTVSPAFNVQYEGLRKPFEVYPGVVVPAGSYASPLAAGMGSTDRRKWISAGMNYNIGGFLSGSQVSLAPNLTIRYGGRLTSSLRWTRNDVDLPQGAFVTNLVSARGTYNFTPLVNTQVLIQYNDRSKRWSANLRFNWQRTAATGLYVVYNDTEAFNGLGPINRAFIIKYSHMFDVLQ
jgi:hypothetical protein